MPSIKLEQFGGMLPAWDAHLLPTGQAAQSRNGYLFSGSLLGWRKPKLLRNLANPDARKVFRIPTVTKSQARAYLVFVTQPADGDTVVVGELTYTFRNTLTTLVVEGGDPVVGLPFEVLIGATTLESAQFLGQAITADSGTNANSGVHYGEQTPLNGSVKYFLPDTDPIAGLIAPTASQDTVGGATVYSILGVGAEDFGAAFNLIKVAESTANVRLTWLYDTATFSAVTTTFRGGVNPTFNNTITAPSAWLEFVDPDTDIVKSPVVDDQFDRFYFASPSQMPEYNTRARIEAGSAPWLLGVPPPGCAVTLDVTGGGNTLTLGNFNADPHDLIVGSKANRVYLLKITPDGATQLQNVTIVGNATTFPDGGYPDAHWAGVLYSDNGGHPDVLMATGIIETGFQADQLNISPFQNPVGLSANTSYWIGIMLDSPIFAFNQGPGTTTNMVSWPNTFTNGPNATAPINSLPHSQLTSTNVNPTAGDFVIVGTIRYTFRAAVATIDATHVEVKIAGSADLTLTNLEHAINASGGVPGTDYSTGTVANTFVSAAAVVSHAIVLTQRSSTLGDGSNCPTTSSHNVLTFPDTTLQPGYTTGQQEFQMYSDGTSDDVLESRSYVYTWVSAYGEEGPPSPPTLLDGWSNGTWTLGLWQPPPDDLGVLRDLRKVNIYRTVPGQGGATVFFFVASVDLGTVTYVDTAGNNTVALNDQLQSTNWFPPPQTLQGLTVMQNGMIAGFTGNEVWFCEPYHPHAWPPGYVLTVDFPIVGMGVSNGALVIATSANPYVVSGTVPSAMGQTKCADPNPCSSRASILSGDGAVSYCSPNGLIQVTAAGVATNTTDLWVAREKWQQLTPQHDARAVILASSYYCLGSISRDGTDVSVAKQGFTIELAQDNTSFSIWPQPGGHRLGLQLLDTPVDDTEISNIMLDPWTSAGLVIANGDVYRFDFGDTAPDLATVTWRSKLYQQNAKRNFTCMKVYFTVPPGTPDQDPVRLEKDADSTDWNTLPEGRYGYIKTYVDKDNDGRLTLIDCREIRESGEVLRIIDGFKCDTWQWEVVSRVNVSNVQIATSVKELAQV